MRRERITGIKVIKVRKFKRKLKIKAKKSLKMMIKIVKMVVMSKKSSQMTTIFSWMDLKMQITVC